MVYIKNEKIRKDSGLQITEEHKKKYKRLSKDLAKKISAHCPQLKYSVHWFLEIKS